MQLSEKNNLVKKYPGLLKLQEVHGALGNIKILEKTKAEIKDILNVLPNSPFVEIAHEDYSIPVNSKENAYYLLYIKTSYHGLPEVVTTYIFDVKKESKREIPKEVMQAQRVILNMLNMQIQPVKTTTFQNFLRKATGVLNTFFKSEDFTKDFPEVSEYFNLFVTRFNMNLRDYNLAAQEALDLYQHKQPVKRKEFEVPKGLMPIKLRIMTDGRGSTIFAHEAISNEEYVTNAYKADKNSFRNFKEVKDNENAIPLNGLTFEKDGAIYTLLAAEDFPKFIGSFFDGMTLFIL